MSLVLFLSAFFLADFPAKERLLAVYVYINYQGNSISIMNMLIVFYMGSKIMTNSTLVFLEKYPLVDPDIFGKEPRI